jgi:hypothetical protein
MALSYDMICYACDMVCAAVKILRTLPSDCIMQETMGDILGDDELEEMRLRDNEEAAQAGKDSSAADAAPARLEGGPEGEQQQQQQQQKPLQPPPGFSANHLFGDVDDDPLDLVTNLSFLNDAEEVSSALHAM